MTVPDVMQAAKAHPLAIDFQHRGRIESLAPRIVGQQARASLAAEFEQYVEAARALAEQVMSTGGLLDGKAHRLAERVGSVNGAAILSGSKRQTFESEQ